MRPDQEKLVRQRSDKHLVFERGNNIGARWLTAAVFASGIVATALIVTLGEASAMTKVEGESNAVSLTAENAPIGEVLAELSAKFGLIYPPTPGLDRTVGGTYSGTLQQVLARILDGCDYVVSYEGDKVELKILGPSASTPRPSSPRPQPSLPAANTAINAPPAGQVSPNTRSAGS